VSSRKIKERIERLQFFRGTARTGSYDGDRGNEGTWNSGRDGREDDEPLAQQSEG
jgi:hypothetical protein